MRLRQETCIRSHVLRLGFSLVPLRRSSSGLYLLLGGPGLNRSCVGYVDACHEGDENGLESEIVILTETQFNI